jgi:UPF0176 protein
MNILNTAAYRFVHLEKNELSLLQNKLRTLCIAQQLKGTILLSREGINLFLAGLPENIAFFKNYLQQDERFKDLIFKDSESDKIPFKRLFVKIKNEIITSGVAELDLLKEQRAPSIAPEELCTALDNEEEIILLDTRNDCEIEMGTFKNAKKLNISHFRQFENAVQQLDPALKEKTIVTFCTGGIRCEKAALIMQKQGFKHVYQLEGGILNYFASCADGPHYEGNCFVFDERMAVDKQLNPQASS